MTDFNTVPIEDLYESTLQSDLGSTDLLAKTVKIITGTLAGGQTTYMGINYDRPSKYELVEINAINGQDVTIVTRALPTKSGGTGTAQNHPAGSKVIITHNYKVFEDIQTAIASKADGTPTLDGSGAVYADTTARDAAVTSPQNGQIVTTAGVLQYYSGGIWNDLDVGTPTPDASDTVAGKVEMATQTEVNDGDITGGTGARLAMGPNTFKTYLDNNSIDESTGVPDAGKLVLTNAAGKVDLSLLGGTPVTTIYGKSTYGSSTTQFDITNPSGDTYRYTYDGTGTDPFIGTFSMIIGQTMVINGQNFNAANNGTFVLTNVGDNFFEVTNASGVAETNKTIGTGNIGSPSTWNKSDRLNAALVEVWASGGAGKVNNSGQTTVGGGGGGAYNFKTFTNTELPSSASLTIGNPVRSVADGVVNGPTTPGQVSSFGSLLSAYGGGGGNAGGLAGGLGAGGGGISSVGVNGANSTTPAKGGSPIFMLLAGSPSIYGGGDTDNASVYGGGGGRSTSADTNGTSVYGGGGGGSVVAPTGYAGSASIYGGNGSTGTNVDSGLTVGANASMPGGGSGGTRKNANLTVGTDRSGWSGSGMIKITEYFI